MRELCVAIVDDKDFASSFEKRLSSSDLLAEGNTDFLAMSLKVSTDLACALLVETSSCLAIVASFESGVIALRSICCPTNTKSSAAMA